MINTSADAANYPNVTDYAKWRELLFDTAGNSDYQSFIDDVLVTGDAADALFELFPDADTSAKKIRFTGIITGTEYGATLGEIQVITVNFITSGAITSAI